MPENCPKIDVRQGDCAEVLASIDPATFDLVYLDPPFFTQKTHRLGPRDRTRIFSFEDLWPSHGEYARFIGERLRQIRRVMSPTGSLYFHCGRDCSHIVRALLDDVFGSDAFRAEIVWSYRRWSNSSAGLLPAHQTILYYTVSESYTFNPIFEGYSPSTNVDQILQRRTRDKFGKSVYQRDQNGSTLSNGAKRGVPLSDVWDIPYLNPKAKERIGYPTQKPLLLLERILRISSNEGDWVLDPFCGSGTTLVAALRLGRNAVGVDSSKDAVELASERLRAPVKTESQLLKLGREAYRTADESALALLEGLEFTAVQRNAGIDAILREDIDGRPILVRIQRRGEPLLEATAKLRVASRGKNAGALVLVCTSEDVSFEFCRDPGGEVLVVRAPAMQLREAIRSLRDKCVSPTATADV